MLQLFVPPNSERSPKERYSKFLLPNVRKSPLRVLWSLWNWVFFKRSLWKFLQRKEPFLDSFGILPEILSKFSKNPFRNFRRAWQTSPSITQKYPPGTVSRIPSKNFPRIQFATFFKYCSRNCSKDFYSNFLKDLFGKSCRNACKTLPVIRCFFQSFFWKVYEKFLSSFFHWWCLNITPWIILKHLPWIPSEILPELFSRSISEISLETSRKRNFSKKFLRNFSMDTLRISSLQKKTFRFSFTTLKNLK